MSQSKVSPYSIDYIPKNASAKDKVENEWGQPNTDTNRNGDFEI